LAVDAYLNPCHDKNAINALPMPDGTVGRTFMSKSQWFEEFAVTSTTATFHIMPFFEAPFSITYNGNGPSIISSPLARGSDNNASRYLSNNKVYAFRCTNKALTIEDSTVVTGLSGDSIAAHKSTDVHHELQQFTNGVVTDTANLRTCYSFPLTLADISSLNGSSTLMRASDGAYGIGYHTSDKWTYLNQIRRTSFPIQTIAANTNNRSLQYVDPQGNQSAFKAQINGVTTTASTPVSYPDNLDLTAIAFSGLTSPTRIVVKFTVIYELLLEVGSPLWDHAVDRPPANMGLMQSLRAFEQMRAAMPGGGTMPAAANAWGDIWTSFKKFVVPALGAGAKIFAPGLSSAINQITSAVQKTVDKPRLKKSSKSRPPPKQPQRGQRGFSQKLLEARALLAAAPQRRNGGRK
jgi:hypothetical protein